MRRRALALSMFAVIGLASVMGSFPASAGHNDDIHSRNVRKLGQKSIEVTTSSVGQGSDLAFQHKLMVAGSYQGTAFYRLLENKPYLRQVSFHRCEGSQGDVSILGKFVFVSIDSPSSNNQETKVCNNTGTTGSDKSRSSLRKEGIRVLDISNLRRPRQVAFFETECGSHTHTLVPKGETTYLYVDSYPIIQTASCNQVNHPKGEFSILKFPTSHPEEAKLVRPSPNVLSSEAVDATGCHDTTVYPKKDLAVAACLGAFATFDISQPANPKPLATVQNPRIELDHSAAITWDGRIAVIGDEHGGAAGGSGGCSNDSQSTTGAMWFYNITKPKRPVLKGHHSLPRVPTVDSPEETERFRCTTHNFNILPTKKRRKYLVVSAYYSGGLAVVDFSRPGNPRERGFYLPQVNDANPDMWSAYWYNGRIYANEHASNLGVSAYRAKGTGRKRVHFFKGRLNPQTQIARFKKNNRPRKAAPRNAKVVSGAPRVSHLTVPLFF